MLRSLLKLCIMYTSDHYAQLLQALVADAQESKALKALLHAHLPILDTLYTAACGPVPYNTGNNNSSSSSSSSRYEYGLSCADFCHLLHTAEILHAYNDALVCRQAYTGEY
jgi:hypothetical protein